MQQAWEQAQRGQGQIVVAVGEPGVGKSRLCYEFKLLCQRRGAGDVLGVARQGVSVSAAH